MPRRKQSRTTICRLVNGPHDGLDLCVELKGDTLRRIWMPLGSDEIYINTSPRRASHCYARSGRANHADYKGKEVPVLCFVFMGWRYCGKKSRKVAGVQQPRSGKATTKGVEP